MTAQLDIEDIKNEITRWAVTKTPRLYQHFAAYLMMDKKEVSKLFKANEELQNHINQYFQEERVQELEELKRQLDADLIQLHEFIQNVIAEKRTVTTDQIAKATGIARCNIKAFAHVNPEMWTKATAIKTFDERARLKVERHALLLSQQRVAKELRTEQREAEKKEKAERHALVLAEHAENRRLKAERRATHEAKTLANAERKKLKAERQDRTARAIANKSKRPTVQSPEPFSSYAVCDYAYEHGRLIKKIYFKLSLLELQKIGYAGHINLFYDGTDCFGIYVHDHDHIGNRPYRTGRDFHMFCFTWHKRLCEEPRVNKMAPIKLNLVETEYKNGLSFMLPEEFFMSYIPD